MKKFLFAAPLALVCVSALHGQAVSVNGGAIQGTITDPSGAAVGSANIVITSKGEGTSRAVTTDKSGFYSIGPLNPGEYVVAISAPGFQKTEVTTRILTGTATPGSFKLTVGQSSETVEVTAGDIQVNTEQAGVSDVITREQVASLPVNGRNFLDLAQIEPGVQLQNGTAFDPTKSGYTGVSVNGVSGRTTRIMLDGQDITDEYVGTTIMVVSQGSVNEFQLNRSTQDVSGEVTSQGQVLVSTRSGTNALHGELFYNFQDGRALYANPNSTPNAAGVRVRPPFQRNQFGGSVGGPIIKDKLFFFGNSERIQQQQAAPNNLGSLFANTPFSVANPTIPSPFKQTYSVARLDLNGPLGGHYFARGSYQVDSSYTGTNYSIYNNRDNTYGVAFGADFSHGKLTHSFRGSYEKFHNFITDGTSIGVYNPVPAVSVNFTAQNFRIGPNINAPQATLQSDKQFRYDGSYTAGSHNIRFGGAINRILGGGAAGFYSLAPLLSESVSTVLDPSGGANNPNKRGCGGVIGAAACPTNPLDGYNISSAGVTISNGLAGATELPGFGSKVGGLTSWRASGYISDSWKITPSFSLQAGVRYTLDTNRANNDLNPVTCGDLLANVSYVCNGLASTTQLPSLIDSSLIGRPNQPKTNLAPQLGFVYSPGNHKTVFRGGFGIFFESSVFNNQTNARGPLVRNAFGYATYTGLCNSYNVTYADGTVHTTAPDGTPYQRICQDLTIGQAAPQIAAIANDYKANAAANPALNLNFEGARLNFSNTFASNYKTPYSEQWNFGLQRELFKGAVISADYIHNTALRIGQRVDLNHIGAARTLSVANALLAINAASTANACGAVTTVAMSQPAITCLISKGANITTLAGQGLDSGVTYTSSNNYTYAGRSRAAAFPGINQNLGSGAFIRPTGRSGYDALQVVYRQSTSHPAPGIDAANLQVSYNLSRIVSNLQSSDQFFSSLAFDNDNPTLYMGRNGLDRKHQVSFGGSFRLKYGPQIGVIGHFFSALPGNLTLDTGSLASGNIFQSDLTGDGTTGDLAPGTNQGAYMHDIKADTLGAYVTNFNGSYAGKATPAGQALINAGLVNLSQLTALKGVIQPIAQLPTTRGNNNPAFRSVDVNFSYPIRFNKLHEGLSLEPGIAFYNVGNFSNFSNYTGTLQNTTTTGGTFNNNSNFFTGANSFPVLAAKRTLRGAGTFSQGAPRQAEFQLKLNF